MAKKKKQQQQIAVVDCDSNSVVDLKSIIHEHGLFFDKLIDLIPSKFYLPVDEDSKPYFQGLSKAKKAAAKMESRDNIKKARRDRLDPDKSSLTTLDLLKQTLQEKKKLEDDSDEDDDENFDSGMGDDEPSVTYEELRQRYRRKLEQLRGNRNNGESERAKRKRNEKSDNKGVQQKKRKRDVDSQGKKPASGSDTKPNEKDVEEAVKELAFSHVKLDNEEEHGKMKKKKKLSKAKELKVAQELAEAKKNPEKSHIASKHSWKAATSRAAGIKIHDNPKLLKESIKKEKKRHQKNAEKWKERAQTTEKMKADKQKTRAGNISERIHQNKMRKIEKREKKLMRPGFEGRKQGFANEPSA